MTYEPYYCLTVKLGDQLANVHSVKDGEVYYGTYRGDALTGLYRKTVEQFKASVAHAIDQGGTVFSLIREPYREPSISGVSR